MNKEYFEVTLPQMLDAREKRAMNQDSLLQSYRKPLLCFTMNIAGPVKNSPMIHQGFLFGLQDLTAQLQRARFAVLHQEVWDESTGNEAFLVIDCTPAELKQLACEIEDADELGRLFDMDVLLPSEGFPGFRKMERKELGLEERRCLLCGRPAKECSSRRLHTVAELSSKTNGILENAAKERISCRIAELAVRALLYEVSITPKPGLVDRNNNGSHKDMDFYSFLNSSAALWPYFQKCAIAGIETKGNADLSELFRSLRLPGKLAENRMLSVTGGVNTHKGAIFTMGIVCAAIAVLDPGDWTDSEKILSVCAEMTRGIVAEDYRGLTWEKADTAGKKLFLEYGITGVRGQMEEGLPVVSQYGLPLLEKLLGEGRSVDEAGAAVLLTILAHMTDTNLISRSDVDTQIHASRQAGELLETYSCPPVGRIELLDQEYIRQNLSPGGSADLLAVCWMLYFVKGEGANYI